MNAPVLLSYGPFPLRRLWLVLLVVGPVLAALSAAGAVAMLFAERPAPALMCERPSSGPGVCEVSTNRTAARVPLAELSGARVGRNQRSNTYEVYLLFLDGTDQKVDPDNLVHQYRVGPTDSKQEAEALAEAFKAFVADPRQREFHGKLSPASPLLGALFLLGLSLLGGVLGALATVRVVRSRSRFALRVEVAELRVARVLWGKETKARTLDTTRLAAVEVERWPQDLWLRRVGLASTPAARLLLSHVDGTTEHLTPAVYPGPQLHQRLGEQLARALGVPLRVSEEVAVDEA